ncbi:MAG: hypothetical protein L0216_16570 [Planctomycetales bacterium]|nr:hypothetical protein [Planctomycetales bacterium]
MRDAPEPSGALVAEASEGCEVPATYVRRYARRECRVPVAIRLVSRGGGGGGELARGRAVVTDISPAGAFLEEIETDSPALPLTPFSIALRATGGDFPGLEALCRPVRAAFEGRLGLAVSFEKLRVDA